MTIYLGIDDTDTRESRGTGRLARAIAAELARMYTVTGVTRHQLFVHPAVPYTSHNSSAVIHIHEETNGAVAEIFETAKELMLADFIEGSAPGICVAGDRKINGDITHFGLAAKTSIVTQDEARSLAREAGILLEGLEVPRTASSARSLGWVSRHRGTMAGLFRRERSGTYAATRRLRRSLIPASTGS